MPIFERDGVRGRLVDQIITAVWLTGRFCYFHFASKQSGRWPCSPTTPRARRQVRAETERHPAAVSATHRLAESAPVALRQLLAGSARDPALRDEVCGSIRYAGGADRRTIRCSPRPTWIPVSWPTRSTGFIGAQAHAEAGVI